IFAKPGRCRPRVFAPAPTMPIRTVCSAIKSFLTDAASHESGFDRRERRPTNLVAEKPRIIGGDSYNQKQQPLPESSERTAARCREVTGQPRKRGERG